MALVITTGEARESLHQIARRFDAGDSEPVYFGSHRRAQAVIVPVGVWEQLLARTEDDLDVATAAARAATGGGSRLSRPEVTALLDSAAETASFLATRRSRARVARGLRDVAEGRTTDVAALGAALTRHPGP